MKQLNEWLTWINSVHKQTIDLSLERVKAVAERLNLLKPSATVITIGGTNGKGSTVAGLEAIYLTAGYRVGAFTSPYLHRFNELVRVQGVEASDEDFTAAFARIEAARGTTTLTQFEFNTLAALDIFQRSQLDVIILEVGLGGRLDAVNIIDADVAVVTSIALDHMDRLGHTRELIAREKAGIFRSDKPVVCGDIDPPETLIQYAHALKSPLYCQNKEFGFERHENDWTFWSENKKLTDLPLPRLALQNMATVLQVVALLQTKLPIAAAVINHVIGRVNLPGRIQVVAGEVTTILDVSHNPAAAGWLANYLQEHFSHSKTRAVFSMLADKDITATLAVMKPYVDEWFVAPLTAERAASQQQLQTAFQQAAIQNVNYFSRITDARHAADNVSFTGDRVVVFGSFYTVNAVCN